MSELGALLGVYVDSDAEESPPRTYAGRVPLLSKDGLPVALLESNNAFSLIYSIR